MRGDSTHMKRESWGHPFGLATPHRGCCPLLLYIVGWSSSSPSCFSPSFPPPAAPPLGLRLAKPWPNSSPHYTPSCSWSSRGSITSTSPVDRGKRRSSSSCTCDRLRKLRRIAALIFTIMRSASDRLHHPREPLLYNFPYNAFCLRG